MNKRNSIKPKLGLPNNAILALNPIAIFLETFEKINSYKISSKKKINQSCFQPVYGCFSKFESSIANSNAMIITFFDQNILLK